MVVQTDIHSIGRADWLVLQAILLYPVRLLIGDIVGEQVCKMQEHRIGDCGGEGLTHSQPSPPITRINSTVFLLQATMGSW